MRSLSKVIETTWDVSTEADIPTPFGSLNALMNGGFRYQHITVVAGVTGMGKTAMGNHIAMYTARNKKKDVAFFSLEMGAKDQLSRLCKNFSGGDERPEHLKEEMAKLPFWLDDTPRVTPGYVRRQVDATNQELAQHGRRLHQVVIDYAQLMQPEKIMQGANRNTELDQIMGDLLGIAKDFNLHLVLLAQINRGPMNRARMGTSPDARPEISDLRDSGTLENTANEILLLYRPDYFREFQTGDGLTEIHVAKNRDGSPGVVKVHFIPDEMTFN